MVPIDGDVLSAVFESYKMSILGNHPREVATGDCPLLEAKSNASASTISSFDDTEEPSEISSKSNSRTSDKKIKSNSFLGINRRSSMKRKSSSRKKSERNTSNNDEQETRFVANLASSSLLAQFDEEAPTAALLV